MPWAAPSGRYLSFAAREENAQLLKAQQLGVCEIPERIGRSPSTISRELRRNAATHSGGLEDRASVAQWHAERRARRPKVIKPAVNDQLRDYVQERLGGTVTDAEGQPIPGPNVPWKGRRHGRAKTGNGEPHGALNSSATGCRSTSPTMSRCGSRTRPSIRGSTSKAWVHWTGS
ncbi:helix-turn-helix domain-containing protein [Streptomyces sp. SID13031]|nr:helix-turn-helix domain-containing protein [Streptomyces sp. SID13031]